MVSSKSCRNVVQIAVTAACFGVHSKTASDLIVDVQLVGVALLHHQAQQVSIAVDLHALELPGLVPGTLIAVEA